jgi:hypothetical protein
VAGGALVTLRILGGELRTGRITTVIPVTDAQWTDTLNAPGTVDQVIVPEAVVRDLDLRHTLPPGRSFLAFEEDDRIRQAGPLWSRTWNWREGKATLGAAGLWSIFDHRMVVPVLAAGLRVQNRTVTIGGTDLGGIARGLVATALGHTGGNLPVVLPAAPAGSNTESFPGWKLYTVGDQLKELTQRETGAPDIAFIPRRRGDDPTFLEWVMRAGTATQPLLTQTGPDWILDTTTRRSPVLGISTDEDATQMGMRSWVTGSGQETDLLMAWRQDNTLLDLGWPLLEVEESRSTVEQQATLDGHADALLARSARPVETVKVTVRRQAAAEIRPGDYAQIITAADPWLGTTDQRMRIRQLSGDLTDQVTLDMYPTEGQL